LFKLVYWQIIAATVKHMSAILSLFQTYKLTNEHDAELNIL